MKQIEYHETFSVREMIAQIIVELSHVWMVRTFVKHSEEAEEMPELMAIPRVLFDCIRSIEEWKEDPARLLRQLQKRLRHLKEAHGELERIVQESIDHTNFRQAVASLAGSIGRLERLHELGAAAITNEPGNESSDAVD